MTTPRKLTVGSLFSGIGGLELGLERAGMEVRWQVEIDEYCRRVLAKHWPDVKRYEDVREVGAHNLEGVDVICGGFPCQPVSTTGRRGGQGDERWLWPEFQRVVRELQPCFVIVENTPGLLTLGMGDVLGGLASLGYDAFWDVYSACATGAPHTRERVFIVGYSVQIGRGGWPAAEPIALSAGGRAGCVWPGPREPNVHGVAYGLPGRVDRVAALGNAVVPQVAEYIGRLILSHAYPLEIGA